MLLLTLLENKIKFIVSNVLGSVISLKVVGDFKGVGALHGPPG